MDRISTEKKILETARRLFNEHGYSKVSMRAIADACGIAVGNLTYYYPKKADIVKTLMEASYTVTKPEQPIQSLKDLHDQFSLMLDTIRLNAFYFLDDEFFDAPREHNHYIRERINAGFQLLREKGCINKDVSDETLSTVLNMILMAHMTWLRRTVRSKTMDKEQFLKAHWCLLMPYLTEEGKAELQNII